MFVLNDVILVSLGLFSVEVYFVYLMGRMAWPMGYDL